MKHTDQSVDNMFIIYDRGPQCISRFYEKFHETMSTRIDLSTTFHSQNNG
jgi:hypothetical protein